MFDRSRLALAAPLALLVGLAACGSETPETPPAAEAPTTAPAETAAPAPADPALARASDPISGGELPAMIVFKSPTCGCCNGWIEHLEGEGFDEIEPRDTRDMATVKRDVGLPTELASCHTAVVEGYVIEGHVPADAVKRLLAERPEGVAGLAVPGMPIGSPGMEGPDPEPYTVYAFDRAGRAEPFMEIDPR